MEFDVRVLQEPEGVGVLTLEAQDAAEAARLAKAQGQAVLSVKSRAGWTALAHWRGRVGSAFQLGLFSQELLALLRAGLSLGESLETMADKETRSEQRKMLRGIVARIYEGHPFSFALRQFPQQFPPLYVATVRASEKTGDISEALARYASYQAQMDALRKRIVSASLYPALLMLVGMLVMLFMMFYVVPKFSSIYAGSGHTLPFLSQLLMSWGRLLEGNKPLVLAVLTGLAGGSIYLTARPTFRRWLMEQFWRIPALRERLKSYRLARFYRSMGMLLHGGIPVVTAMDMVSGMLPAAERLALGQAAQDIREGKPISVAMDSHGLTTAVSLRLLRVGERTGDMSVMMERIAVFYDEDISRWLDWFTRLFEPLLMAFIGGVIGLIVLLMYMPIFELAGGIR